MLTFFFEGLTFLVNAVDSLTLLGIYYWESLTLLGNTTANHKMF